MKGKVFMGGTQLCGMLRVEYTGSRLVEQAREFDNRRLGPKVKAWLKISGADANMVLNAFVQAALKDQTGSSTSDESISGKSVKKVTTTTTATPSYVYAHGDVVFFVSGDDMTLVTEAFSKLP